MSTVLLKSTSHEEREIIPLTVGQYHGMIKAGILAEGEPIELLDGMLVRISRGEGLTAAREPPSGGGRVGLPAVE
jgi:hypothetical protein